MRDRLDQRRPADAGRRSPFSEAGRGEPMAPTVHRLVECGIPVMGHIGLTPQSVNALGGYRVQGRGLEAAERLLRDALALEQAGAYAIVLELVPSPLAGLISSRLTIPTIGIGAGAGVRRAGPGAPRHAGVVHQLLAQARQAVRPVVRVYKGCLRPVRSGGRSRGLSHGQAELHHGPAVLQELQALSR